MEGSIFERIRGGLMAKRQNLAEWLQVTPARKKQIRLGPNGEQAVQAHLQVLDTALHKAADGTLGLCQVCHEHVDSGLLEMDYTACVCLDHLSDEERRRLEADLELSQVVQKGLLPQQVPTIPGLDLAVFHRPAQIVGGDYFDFFSFRDGAPGLAIADVAGHGMSASLLMASVQTALRTLIPDSDSPGRVLERLNRFFHHNVHVTTFVTLFLARIDLSALTLTYSSAGHNPPLLCRGQNGRAECLWLQPTGAAIGLIEEFRLVTETVPLEPGDIMLLYTDGVTEAVNPQDEEFGQERLAAVVGKEAGSSAKDLVRAVRQALLDFTGRQDLADDATILAGKIQ